MVKTTYIVVARLNPILIGFNHAMVGNVIPSTSR
jgi:hypothetical protein